MSAGIGSGSLGYASRLSRRDDYGGQLGAAEYFAQEAEVEEASRALAELIAASRRVVAFTGAGVSTSCGVPDFRGPNGVWTRERKGLPPPAASLPFELARPGLTHMAIRTLAAAGKVVYTISQNVDCLHLRSGIPRDELAELHGNCFAERCEDCGAEYVRDFEVESVGFKLTGRRCTARKKRARSRAKGHDDLLELAGPVCGGRLRDNCLDWEDALPVKELRRSERECRDADLVLCLGTSMEITPACNLPLKAVRKGGKMAIVNLQKTPKDSKAALVIRARVDDVMSRVMRMLGMEIFDYVRVDRFVVETAARHAFDEETCGEPAGASGVNVPGEPERTRLQITLRNAGGARCPPPTFAARLHARARGGARASTSAAPRLSVRVPVASPGTDADPFLAHLDLSIELREGVRPTANAAGSEPVSIAVAHAVAVPCAKPGCRTTRGAAMSERAYEVETCRIKYSHGGGDGEGGGDAASGGASGVAKAVDSKAGAEIGGEDGSASKRQKA